MKKLILGIFLVVSGIVAGIYFSRLANKEISAEESKIYHKYNHELNAYEVRKLVNTAKTIEDLEKAEKMFEVLVEPYDVYKDRTAAYIHLKKSVLLFNEAEEFLNKAVEIETAVANPTADVPNPPMNPLAQKMLANAIGLWEKSRKESEKIKDSDTDDDFNYHFNYLKGEIYYRFLQFMSDQETAKEMFNQTITYYRHALDCRPADINTVINIELLIKNEKSLLAGANDPQMRQKQMLNSKKQGIGKSSGN